MDENILDTTKHVKVWISEIPDEPFGGALNDSRLIKHRSDYPDHTISIIVDKSQLSNNGLKKLSEFSKSQKLNIIDLTDLEKELSEDEKKLLAYARKEISHPEPCLAVPSNIIRWFKAVLKKGIYSDVDFEFSTPNCPKTIKLKGNCLIDFCLVRAYPAPGAPGTPAINDCFLAFPDTEHVIIKTMQELLLENYKNGCESIFEIRKPIMHDTDKLKKHILDLVGPGLLMKCLSKVYCNNNDLLSEQFMEQHNIADLPFKIGYRYYPELSDNTKHSSDISWLPGGTEKMNQNNTHITNAVTTLQKHIRGYHARYSLFNKTNSSESSTISESGNTNDMTSTTSLSSQPN